MYVRRFAIKTSVLHGKDVHCSLIAGRAEVSRVGAKVHTANNTRHGEYVHTNSPNLQLYAVTSPTKRSLLHVPVKRSRVCAAPQLYETSQTFGVIDHNKCSLLTEYKTNMPNHLLTVHFKLSTCC